MSSLVIILDSHADHLFRRLVGDSFLLRIYDCWMNSCTLVDFKQRLYPDSSWSPIWQQKKKDPPTKPLFYHPPRIFFLCFFPENCDHAMDLMIYSYGKRPSQILNVGLGVGTDHTCKVGLFTFPVSATRSWWSQPKSSLTIGLCII